MKKTKRYEDGGFTFADVSDEDRQASIDAALADIDRRGVEQARELAAERAMGVEVGEEKPVKRAASKAKAEPARKAEKPEAKAKPEAPARSERAPSSVKVEPITGPAPAKSRESALPDVAARKAATAARQRRSAFGGENKGVYGMSAGGKASSASRRADGCAVRGKTKGRMV